MPTQDYSQQVFAAFTFLRDGLRPFVEQEMKTTYVAYKDQWLEQCQKSGVRPNREGKYTWDVLALLKVITNSVCWRDAFAMEKRRGAIELGMFVTLREWRHEFKGHDDKAVAKVDAQKVIETVVHALRCIDAKDELEKSEELLRSLLPQTQHERVSPVPSSLETPLPKSEPPAESPGIGSSDAVTIPIEFAPIQTGRTTDFWGAYHFDFADPLNDEIWRLSPKIQQQVQSWEH